MNKCKNRQSAAKALLNEQSSTTISQESTGTKNTGKRLVYLKEKNVIYKITCISNNKIYIGSASHYDKRMGTHISLLRKGEHDNPYLQSSFNKYGESSFIFEIIEKVKSKQELLSKEQYWLDKFQCYKRNIGFNCCKSAFSRIGQKMSPEARKKIGDFWRGKKFSKERIEKLKKERADAQGKKIIVYNKKMIKLFESISISEAARKTKVSTSAISKQCKNKTGNRREYKNSKFVFRYKDIV